jgi:hypothetical protein
MARRFRRSGEIAKSLIPAVALREKSALEVVSRAIDSRLEVPKIWHPM